jgi:hypothetical protein
MAALRYEYCKICDILWHVNKRLDLPPKKTEKETPKEFWARVEQAGQLIQALKLYDEVAAEQAEWARVPRETKQQFAERIEQEGRRDEVERVRAELLQAGQSQREAQVELVERFQPLDGRQARAWETPDPWESGRLFKSKEEEVHLMNLAYAEEDEDAETMVARDRVEWAEHRRDERWELAAARRRAQELKQEQERQKRQQAQSARAKTINGAQPPRAASSAGKDREIL